MSGFLDDAWAQAGRTVDAITSPDRVLTGWTADGWWAYYKPYVDAPDVEVARPMVGWVVVGSGLAGFAVLNDGSLGRADSDPGFVGYRWVGPQ